MLHGTWPYLMDWIGLAAVGRRYIRCAVLPGQIPGESQALQSQAKPADARRMEPAFADNRIGDVVGLVDLITQAVPGSG